MADIVNLRQARKVKARAEREREAASNRALFGQSKAQRAKHAAERQQAQALLDGVRRQRGEDADSE